MIRVNRQIDMFHVAILLLALFLWGCAYFSKEASVQTAVSDEGSPKDAGKVAVPLFIHEKYKAGKEKEWPDSTITDRFVTGLIQHGYDVMDRAHIRKTMLENQLHPKDLYKEDNIQKIGMLLHVDTIVMGKLTLIEQQNGTILSRKLNIRGIRVLDGVVLFSLSAVDTTMYRILSGEDLVDQIVAKMLEPSDDSDKSTRPSKPSKSDVSFKASAEGEMDIGVPTQNTDTELSSDEVEEPIDTQVADEDEVDKESGDEDGLFVAPKPSDTELNGETDTSVEQ